MGRYEFEVAARTDDAELRSILAATPMDGPISVSFRREPSFLDTASVEGDFHQAVVCRDRQVGRIVGFGCRSVRTRYLNGQPAPIGYLSALRVRPEYRRRGLVARAYEYLHQLHGDGRAGFYLTTIAAGNENALGTLTAGRAGLPTYRFVGNYHSMVVGMGRRRCRSRVSDSVEIRSATNADLSAVLELLRVAGPSRQFFPCYEAGDFFHRYATFRDLKPAEILLAFRGGQLVGMFGGWDQFAFKQSVVERYTARLRWSRQLYNAWARLRRLPMLPPVNKPLRYLTGALPLALDDDPDVFRALLESVIARNPTERHGFLLLGLHESDPLLPLAQTYQLACYLTKVYLVYWDGGVPSLAHIDERPAYLELGCL
jgi:GNAT superfamily N-acetyltransferase